MINGMNIFYGSNTGSGLKVVSNNKGKGLQTGQTKKGGSCNKKCNKERIKGSGFKNIKINVIFLINIL